MRKWIYVFFGTISAVSAAIALSLMAMAAFGADDNFWTTMIDQKHFDALEQRVRTLEQKVYNLENHVMTGSPYL